MNSERRLALVLQKELYQGPLKLTHGLLKENTISTMAT